MNAIVREQLVILDPGPDRNRLLALGVFRVKGRLRPGQPREVQVSRVDAHGRLVLPRGLLSTVRRQVSQLHVQDQRLHFHPLDFGWVGQLRPEQYALVQTILRRGGNGVAVSMTGSGKTIVGLAAIAALQQPALWITHRKDLAVAVREAVRSVWEVPASAVGYLGEGQTRFGTHLTVAMVQTLAKRDNADLQQRIGTIVVDESHHIPAISYHSVLSQFPAKYRLGLTGTYEREDGLHPLIGALFGPRIVLPDQVLVQLRRVMLPTIYPVYTRFTAPEGLAWAHLQQARAADTGRNLQVLKLIRDLAQRGRFVLVLVSRVDHAQYLAHQLTHNHIPAVAVVGSMPVVERQQWYRRFLARRCVLIATSLADEGLDLPQCDTLVFVTPGKAASNLRQRGGRVMRTALGKGDARIYDVVDPLVPTLAKQWQARQRVYQQAQWPVQKGDSHGQTSAG